MIKKLPWLLVGKISRISTRIFRRTRSRRPTSPLMAATIPCSSTTLVSLKVSINASTTGASPITTSPGITLPTKSTTSPDRAWLPRTADSALTTCSHLCCGGVESERWWTVGREEQGAQEMSRREASTKKTWTEVEPIFEGGAENRDNPKLRVKIGFPAPHICLSSIYNAPRFLCGRGER